VYQYTCFVRWFVRLSCNQTGVVLYRGACERWIFGIMGFQGFKEWLGVLRVNDVISYRSFFLQGSSRKKKRFKYFCGASLSLWVECDVVSILSTTVCLFSAFYLMITFYLPLHSLCYNLMTTSILSETHQWTLRWFLASEYCLKNGDYPCLSKGAGEAWLHRWCDDGRIQSIRTPEEKQFFTTI
jgi:hypothetical protein